MLCSWELGLPTKKRRKRYGSIAVEAEDEDEDALDTDDEEESRDEIDSTDLDDLTKRPLAKASTRNRSSHPSNASKSRSYSVSSSNGTTKPEADDATNGLPLEEQWEVDDEAVNRLSSPPTTKFRQCVQSHTDVSIISLSPLRQER